MNVAIVVIMGCCFSVLLQNKADPTIKNVEGQTAIDVAEPICKSILKGGSA